MPTPPAITLNLDPANKRLTWDAVTDRRYRLFRALSLATPNWTQIDTTSPLGSNQSIQHTDNPASTRPKHSTASRPSWHSDSRQLPLPYRLCAADTAPDA